MLGAIAGDIAGSTASGTALNHVASRSSRRGAGSPTTRCSPSPPRTRSSPTAITAPRTIEDLRPTYGFDVSCQGSVPEAIIALLDAADVEHAIRDAIWLGGDADTQAAIAGSLAEAWHEGVPAPMRAEAISRLSDDLREVTDRFATRYMKGPSGDAA